MATTVGAPPPLQGQTPEQLLRFAIACRSSALVLDLEHHPAPAARLRALARTATHRAALAGTARRLPPQPRSRAA